MSLLLQTAFLFEPKLHLLILISDSNREEASREETSIDILKRALEICPQLATPPGQKPIQDLSTIVKGAVVGFRPTREQGIRLEVDAKRLKSSIPVIHNYGHGGYGWQSCWASAEEAQRMVGEQLRMTKNFISAKL